MYQVEPKPTWASQVIKRDEVTRYLQDGRDFIDDARRWRGSLPQ